MSDNINSIIAQPIGIDASIPASRWAQIAQLNAATAGQQINNKASQLSLLQRQVMAAPYLPGGALYNQLTGQSGAAASAPPPPGNQLAPLAPGSGAAASAYPGASASPGATNLPPAPVDGALVAMGKPIARAPMSLDQPLPAGATVSAQTHSAGMPEPGQMIGGLVSPTGAVQTLYGVPLPYGYAQAVAFAGPDKAGEILKAGMEARRQRLQELLSQPDWNQGVTQAYSEGWMDPAHLQYALAHPESRNAALAGLASPDTYQTNLEKYSGQGLRPDPQTGNMVFSPVSMDAKRQAAQSSALGTAQGQLPNAAALSYAESSGTNQATQEHAAAIAAATKAGQNSQTLNIHSLPIGPKGSDGQPTNVPVGMTDAQWVQYGRTGVVPAGATSPQSSPAASGGGGFSANNPLMQPGMYGLAPANGPASPGAAAPAPQAAPSAPPSQLARMAGTPAQTPQQRVPSNLPPVQAPGPVRNVLAPMSPPAPVAAPSTPAAQPATSGMPPGVPGFVAGVPELSPQQKAAQDVQVAEQKKIAEGYGDTAASVVQAGQAAPDVLSKLDVLEQAAQQFRPGATGQARLDMTKRLVDAMQSIGITPPDSWVQSAANGEAISKEGGQLTAAMTRSLGTHEAAAIFQSLASISPNVTMSSGGFPIIIASLREGAQRSQDLMNFQENWLAPASEGGRGKSTTAGMLAAFNKQAPPEAYASRVIPFPTPPKPSDAIPNVTYRTPRGPMVWTGSGFKPVAAQ